MSNVSFLATLRRSPASRRPDRDSEGDQFRCFHLGRRRLRLLFSPWRPLTIAAKKDDRPIGFKAKQGLGEARFFTNESTNDLELSAIDMRTRASSKQSSGRHEQRLGLYGGAYLLWQTSRLSPNSDQRCGLRPTKRVYHCTGEDITGRLICTDLCHNQEGTKRLLQCNLWFVFMTLNSLKPRLRPPNVLVQGEVFMDPPASLYSSTQAVGRLKMPMRNTESASRSWQGHLRRSWSF